ncbi:hypothetical protein PENTCL1PPCAC_968, partial [Pristionchus entomophagus]
LIYQIANDIILFAIITVAIGIWELIPANCILQYLALCRPQYSNSKRLLIAFSTCASLVVVPMVFAENIHLSISVR